MPSYFDDYLTQQKATNSVAPFIVELFDYDREWYQKGEKLPGTYVQPGSKPLATAIVKP